MLRLDLNLTAPAEQLAADEAVLDWCEAGHGDEALVFWEPCVPFIVVGYANKVTTEVNVAAAETGGVPVFRRCSGGGTVVQMPGGLKRTARPETSPRPTSSSWRKTGRRLKRN